MEVLKCLGRYLLARTLINWQQSYSSVQLRMALLIRRMDRQYACVPTYIVDLATWRLKRVTLE